MHGSSCDITWLTCFEKPLAPGVVCMLGSIDLSQLLFEKDRCVRIHIVQPLQDFVTIGSEVAGGLQACVCYPCPLLARWKVSRDCVLMGIEGRPEVSTPLAPAQHAWVPHLQSPWRPLRQGVETTCQESSGQAEAQCMLPGSSVQGVHFDTWQQH